MVNGTMIQQLGPNRMDTTVSAATKSPNNSFQNVLNKTNNQKSNTKSDESGETSDETQAQTSQLADDLAQMLMQSGYSFNSLDSLESVELGVVEIGLQVSATVLDEAQLEGMSREEVILEGDTSQKEGKESTQQMEASEFLNQYENTRKQVTANESERNNTESVGSIKTTSIEADEAEDVLLNLKEADRETGDHSIHAEAGTLVNEARQPMQSSAGISVQTVHVNPEKLQDMTQDISEKMLQNMREGVREFEIQLEPANLGKLAIKVSYEAGKAAISIVCSSAKTLEAMSQNARTIGDIIEARLGTETAIVVDQAEPDYLEQSNQQNQEQAQQQNNQAKKQSETESAEQIDFLQQLRLGLL